MKQGLDGNKNMLISKPDEQAASRKGDHIELAFQARTTKDMLDSRFVYEPMLSAHPIANEGREIPFLGKTLHTPIWASSMTGGAEHARTINVRLAKACRIFGMGMGLGSCRPLLTSDVFFEDFDVRDHIGPDLPLYANLGIAQVEELIRTGAQRAIRELIDRLRADGLILHINPLQEWFQPEGNRLRQTPLNTLRQLLDLADYPIIVKEVGQGMGYESLRYLLHLPIAALDFGAAGGTNFSLLENLRDNPADAERKTPMIRVGHDAQTMTGWVNSIFEAAKGQLSCRQIIISGGVNDFLDGYYFTKQCKLPAIYGQASALLRYALKDEDALHHYIEGQREGLAMANAYLRVRKHTGNEQ